MIERSGVKREYNPHNDRNAVMASFNLLWMDGYSPEISYLTREDRDVLSVEGIKYKKATSIAISLLWMLPHNLIDFIDLNYHQRYLT